MLRSKEAGLLPLALAITMGMGLGWWAHGGHADAKEISGSVNTPPQVQMIGTGRDAILSVYYPGQRTFYTYPVQAGSSGIACINQFKINGEGQQIDRQNCPNGKLY